MGTELNKAHTRIYTEATGLTTTETYQPAAGGFQPAAPSLAGKTGAAPASYPAMPSYGKVLAVIASLSAISCTQSGETAAKTEGLGKLSPDVFSHDDQVAINDQACLGRSGVFITANSVGPVALGMPLSQLRKRCPVAVIKVPQSMATQGPVFGVSVAGGLIVFTVAGKDSVIETVGTSNPAFRTMNGIGVGTPARGLSFRKGRVCFAHDSIQVTRVLISRRTLGC